MWNNAIMNDTTRKQLVEMYVKLMPHSNKTERLIIWPKITWLDPKRLRGSVFPRLPLLVGYLDYVNWWGGAIRPPEYVEHKTDDFNETNTIWFLSLWTLKLTIKSRKCRKWGPGSKKKKKSENFAIFTSILKCHNFFVYSQILMKL